MIKQQCFIDQGFFNCPFCKEKAEYKVLTEIEFDYSKNNKAYVFTVQCFLCEKISLYISKYQMDISYNQFTSIYDEQMRKSYEVKHTPIADIGSADIKQMLEQGKLKLDDLFFFNLPEN